MIQVEEKSATETAQHVEMKNMSKTLVGGTICDFFTTEYCAAANGFKHFSFSFVESVVAKMIHCVVMDEIFNHSSNRWSRSFTIMQALEETIVNDPD